MNREDIIRMAREAGIDAEKDTLCRFEGWVEPIERFAQAAYAAGAAAEREACARICEIQSWDGPLAADDIAEAIRARGEK